jgi:hypothetical protein
MKMRTGKLPFPEFRRGFLPSLSLSASRFINALLGQGSGCASKNNYQPRTKTEGSADVSPFLRRAFLFAFSDINVGKKGKNTASSV